MGTSLTTANLGLRYPAGLVGEPPDVADDIRKLASDVDGWLPGRGTWTPTIATSAGTFSAGGSPTYLCRYSIVGYQVTIQFRLDLGSSPSFGTGNITITNIPVALYGGSTGVGSYLVTGTNFPVPLMAYMSSSTVARLDLLGNGTTQNSRLSLITPQSGDRLAFTLTGVRNDI